MIHEENGQIIVDELRPMSDAPLKKVILVKKKSFDKLIEAVISDKTRNMFSGWIPMPTYRPKDGA